jgi:hypothetical protein
VAYGIHMSACTRTEEGDVDKLWISKRSNNVAGYPGFLDDTVAGGMQTGETPYNTRKYLMICQSYSLIMVICGSSLLVG